MTIEAIKEVIIHLSEPERHQLVEWFHELKEDDWDRQLENDFAPGGRGMRLLDEAEADLTADRARPLAEVSAEINTNRKHSKSGS